MLPTVSVLWLTGSRILHTGICTDKIIEEEGTSLREGCGGTGGVFRGTGE